MSSNLEVRKIEPGTPEHGRAVAMADTRVEDIDGNDQRTWPRARSLRYWVDLWGGYSTTLTAPDGTEHDIHFCPGAKRIRTRHSSSSG